VAVTAVKVTATRSIAVAANPVAYLVFITFGV
jgi:hypothetical protein